jgi:peptidoglycan/xylan/chitin deacetylase (PgdA/CDA1 family)
MPEYAIAALRVARRAVLRMAKWTGVFAAAGASQWRRDQLLILAFHSLALDEEHRWRRLLYFTLPEFRERLRLLQRTRAAVLPLDEAITRLEAGTLPPRSVALTFDDGQADFLHMAWPELVRCGYPATVYATTYYSDKRVPIFPLMCSYVLWKARHRRLSRMPQCGVDQAVDLADETAREAAAQAIVARAVADGLTAEARDERLATIADLLGVDYAQLTARRVLQVMTPEEIADVAARGADVQLHTHRHRMPRDRDSFVREVEENRVRIESRTGRRAVHFCYPSGVHFPDCVSWLHQLNIRTATTCDVALARRGTPLMTLPRLIDTAEIRAIEIEGWVTGVSQWLPRRRTRDVPLPTRASFAVAR